MQTIRLSCSWCWVDVRLQAVNGHWIASAETPDGPSIGVGSTAREAISASLHDYEGALDELLASAPDGLLESH